MEQKNLGNAPESEMYVPVTLDTFRRIACICEKFQCRPGRYIEALVAHDQHPYPQERLAVEFDLMLMDAAAVDHCSD